MEKKKESRSRSWLVTAPADGEHAYSRDELLAALAWCDAYLGQQERGEKSGYLHWQILLQHGEPIRFSTLRKKLPHCHLEPRRGTVAQAVAYVTKADTRVPELAPLAKGEIKGDEQGKRNDLDELRAIILEGNASLNELVMEHPRAASYASMCRTLIEARDAARWGDTLRDVQVHVLYGDTGTGKTRAMYQDRKYSEVCRVTHYGSGCFDDYSGQAVLALDEFTGQLPLEQLLTMLDIYPLRLPARYADKTAAYSTVFIASNLPPWAWYPHAPQQQLAALARRFTSVRWFERDREPEEIALASVASRMGLASMSSSASLASVY